MTTIEHLTGKATSLAAWPRGIFNLHSSQLIEHAVRAGSATLSSKGALVAETAPRTGRSVHDKYIVRDNSTAQRVAWGGFNTPIEPDVAGRLQGRVADYLHERRVYIVDAWAGAQPAYRLGVRVVAEYAWHALFARQLLLRTSLTEQDDFVAGFTVLVAPDFQCDPETDGVRSSVAIVLDFDRKLVTIAGTKYAGEIKKSIFSYLNYVLPEQRVLPMHCSANVGSRGDVALFFGLSGTGKTTLSADPERNLIGDDEHGWGDDGVFNFEGGCYAKCANLRRESEPQIFDAIKFGAVLENVVLDPLTRQPNFDDLSITENTRAAYPIDFIEGAVSDGSAGHPSSIIFLTADAFGVLPPISKLDSNQALYYFLSGYTAKLAGTEADMGADPEATFSAGFGAPFFALPPTVFASMLRERLIEHSSKCYLLNTGWTGGPYGVGRRISLSHTRLMVHAVLSGSLTAVATAPDPIFGLQIPEQVPGVPDGVLRPSDTWPDREAYNHAARRLAGQFRANFQAFASIDEAVVRAGPLR